MNLMTSRLAMLAIAGAASVTVIGGAAHSQPALSQTCAFKAGPLDGQIIDFSGVPGVVAAPVGDRCADMQGSSGEAVEQGTAGAIPQGAARTQGQGRYYASPNVPMAWPRVPSPAWGQRCRFNRGPASGTILDYSHTLGAVPLAIGARCADGASSGVIVASPGM